MSDLRHVYNDRWDALKSVLYPELGKHTAIAKEPMVWDAVHKLKQQAAEIERLNAELEVERKVTAAMGQQQRALQGDIAKLERVVEAAYLTGYDDGWDVAASDDDAFEPDVGLATYRREDGTLHFTTDEPCETCGGWSEGDVVGPPCPDCGGGDA